MSDLSAQEIIAALHRLKHWQDLDEFEKQMLHQAAETIEQLQEQVAELEGQVVDAILDCSNLHTQNVALQAQVAEMKKYADHKHNCWARDEWQHECTCGLDGLLEQKP